MSIQRKSRSLPASSKERPVIGARRTGKSFLLKHQIPAQKRYDLLHADVFQALSQRPSSIRESLKPSDKIVVIDEIQKLPSS